MSTNTIYLGIIGLLLLVVLLQEAWMEGVKVAAPPHPVDSAGGGSGGILWVLVILSVVVYILLS